MRDIKIVINELLDRIQEREKLNETELARYLKVDPATVWRWRNGDVGKAASILLSLQNDEYEREQQPTAFMQIAS
jgi:transcriptional regulator with XRE-family HTH domain